MAPESAKTHMTAYEIDPVNSGDRLSRVTRPIPVPAPGEVLVRLTAASLNYRDLLVAERFYGPTQQAVIALSDGVGEIVGTGPDVPDDRIGERVAGAFFPDWVDGPPSAARRARSFGAQVDGMLAEYAVMPAHAAIQVPGHLSDTEAATLPCASVTAWHAVTIAAGLRPGQTILLQGAGGVSTWALRFAKLAGLRVIQTASNEAKAEALRELGADHVVSSADGANWAGDVLELTCGLGADAIVDIGGPGSLALSQSAIRVGGTIVGVGFAGTGPGIDARLIVGRAITLKGITVGSCEMFSEMNRAIAAAGLRPSIFRTFAMDEAPAAFDCLRAGRHVGKVVISIAGP